MIKNGCTPSAEVYKALMTWSSRRGKFSVAFSLWLMYLRSLPGREEEIKLAEELFKEGKVVEAIRELLKTDCKLWDFDSAPYIIWLTGLCLLHKPEEALKVFSVLVECGVNLSPESCVMLINILCKVRNLDQAINVFVYTMEKGFMLEPRICNRLLNPLLRSPEKTKHAFDLMDRMEYAGYDLDAYLHRSTKLLSLRRWNTWDS